MSLHVSVLLAETLKLLAPCDGEAVLDCTLGLGGHSEALLKRIGQSGVLVGLDADPKNLEFARTRLQKFSLQTHLIHANFKDLPHCLPDNLRSFDMILADLGLSSPHIDVPERGFTFRANSELDMRFDQTSGMTAAMYIASVDRTTLRDVLQTYGEIPAAHRLTDALIARRADRPVRRSEDLVAVVENVYGFQAKNYLSQIFQALRIAVNDEMAALETVLREGPKLLKPAGRLAIISYHSLEDRLVKQAMKFLSTDVKDPITGAAATKAGFDLLTNKPIVPTEKEIHDNPRSRSARLRAIRKSLRYTPRP